MLATLERGIKGGKWYSLDDKVWKMENLQRAVEEGGSGQKREEGGRTQMLGRYAEQSAPATAAVAGNAQRTANTNPNPCNGSGYPKLGSKELRPLGVPPVENRVVEMALRNVIEPIFEHRFAEHSYGFRPGRGAKDALRRVDATAQSGEVLGGGRRSQRLLRQHSTG